MKEKQIKLALSRASNIRAEETLDPYYALRRRCKHNLTKTLCKEAPMYGEQIKLALPRASNIEVEETLDSY